MGLWITRVMGFLHDNFQLAKPFHSWLRVRYRTDRRWPSALNAPTLWGRGITSDETVWTIMRQTCAHYELQILWFYSYPRTDPITEPANQPRIPRFARSNPHVKAAKNITFCTWSQRKHSLLSLMFITISMGDTQKVICLNVMKHSYIN